MDRRILAAALLAVATIAPAALAGPVATAVGDEPEVHFTAAGDYAAGSNAQAVFATIGGLAPDFNLALGDLSYGTTGAEQAWCDLVTAGVGAGFPFELIAGNHESNGLNGNINDFSACLPNQLPGLIGTYGRQWYVDVPAGDPLVRVVAISPALTFPDGTWQYTAGSPRYEWTAAAIDGARSSGIPWVVVALHKPCLSLGEYACDPGPDLNQLLLTKRVDLVLTGHEHLYQRTAQLALGTGCTTLTPGVEADPDCIADADDDLVKGAGTVFATVGTGGQVQRAVHTDDPEIGYFVAASGSADPTWGALDVRATATSLTASFARASGSSFTDGFTITAGGPATNQPPLAAFSTATSGLTATLDATASSDLDGTVVAWDWDFGDGTTGTGETTTHEYATGGTYTVQLTVTDDDDATATTSHDVTVVDPGTALALDTFTRTVTDGWGTADLGGPWSTSGTSSRFAVTGSTGTWSMAPGASVASWQTGVSSASTEVQLTLATDLVPAGSGAWVHVQGRRVSAAEFYGARLRYYPDGTVALQMTRGNGTVVAGGFVPGLTVAAGDRLRIRLQVEGTGPTVERAKVWKLGESEPAGWFSEFSDATAGLQVPGGVGLSAYATSSAGPAFTLSVDDWWAGPVGAVPGGNLAPVAAFTATPDGLSVGLDGTASADPDGTVVAWDWDFGDGTTGTGETTTHEYATGGTYTVQLTVTDDGGATGSTAVDVTVFDPTVNQPPAAAFTASVTGLGVSLDGTTSTDPDGTVVAWDWDFGDGTTGTGETTTHEYAAGGTYTVELTVTDDDDATATTSQDVTVVDPGAALALDTFTRTVTDGWGTADLGGPWSTSGAASVYSVSGGEGRILLPSGGSGPDVSLPGSATASTDLVVTLGSDKVPGGSGLYTAIAPRRTAAGEYRVRLQIRSNGAVQLGLARVEGSETAIVPVATVPGLTFTAGDRLVVRVQASGTNPTLLRAKVWSAASAEPAAWLASATDTTAALQTSGYVGINNYLSSSATNTPIVLSVDDLAVRLP
ncbi:PKD domain-containing protein [Actinotalea sp. M2MS4P-6]|uniref:PKD domain-containing protein n=1 Tax=Actinotalea sp. M2MS4P-6 TaxID=2983762 RepID=UPI0021E386D3|nr:PKD domain-containing protein [Actinotalea sp. M2MS4P-6]MCV2394230.1 PKD domain-containing protein [Actinotalea sp. M2MS4P-6]